MVHRHHSAGRSTTWSALLMQRSLHSRTALLCAASRGPVPDITKCHQGKKVSAGFRAVTPGYRPCGPVPDITASHQAKNLLRGIKRRYQSKLRCLVPEDKVSGLLLWIQIDALPATREGGAPRHSSRMNRPLARDNCLRAKKRCIGTSDTMCTVAKQVHLYQVPVYRP